MSTGSSPWGRIDADGTAYATSAAGDRVIGSWQAGDADAGMAYYRRRFKDLETEVTLLEVRLASGAGDPGSTRTQALALKEQIPTAAAIGDLDSLAVRVEALLAAAQTKTDEAAAARQAARAEAIAAKEALTVEAEQIAERASSWKASGDRLRVIVDEWKLIKGVDRKTDEALWKRFSAARDEFGRRRGAHFAALDTERVTAKTTKEKLVERATELAASSDWKETAAAMKDLMAAWKAAPRTSKDIEDALWTRFRAAQDSFFERRSGTFAERDAEQRVREATDAGWKRSSTESNPFLAALRDRLAEAEQKLERARKSGDAARIAKAELDVEQRRSLIPS